MFSRGSYRAPSTIEQLALIPPRSCRWSTWTRTPPATLTASGGIDALVRLLAAEDPALRLSGARAVAHILSSSGADVGFDVFSLPAPTTRAMLDGGKMFGSDDMSDITFIVAGQRLPCHRILLKMTTTSEVLERMMEAPTQDAEAGAEVEVKETTFEALRHAMRFVYTGELDASVGSAEEDGECAVAQDVFALANRWLMEPLRHECAVRMARRLQKNQPPGIDIAVPWMPAAALRRRRHRHLRRHCGRQFEHRRKQLCSTPT